MLKCYCESIRCLDGSGAKRGMTEVGCHGFNNPRNDEKKRDGRGKDALTFCKAKRGMTEERRGIDPWTSYRMRGDEGEAMHLRGDGLGLPRV